jgi:cellulose biosynthesis protein BcsQ
MIVALVNQKGGVGKMTLAYEFPPTDGGTS